MNFVLFDNGFFFYSDVVFRTGKLNDLGNIHLEMGH
jgi:hypothetical protein